MWPITERCSRTTICSKISRYHRRHVFELASGRRRSWENCVWHTRYVPQEKKKKRDGCRTGRRKTSCAERARYGGIGGSTNAEIRQNPTYGTATPKWRGALTQQFQSLASSRRAKMRRSTEPREASPEGMPLAPGRLQDRHGCPASFPVPARKGFEEDVK